MASRLSCNSLACGVETGTANDFLRLAKTALSLSSGESIKTATAGRNQTEDLAKALPELASLLEQPNALLALEYAKAILHLPFALALLTIPRTGASRNRLRSALYQCLSPPPGTGKRLFAQIRSYLPSASRGEHRSLN